MKEILGLQVKHQCCTSMLATDDKMNKFEYQYGSKQ